MTSQLRCLRQCDRLECGPSGNMDRDTRYCIVVPLNLYLHKPDLTAYYVVNVLDLFSFER